MGGGKGRGRSAFNQFTCARCLLTRPQLPVCTSPPGYHFTTSSCYTMSSSLTQGATPIAAISSSLSKRPTPTLPPASQIYEPHVRSILARRLVRRVFTTSVITSWILASLWMAWMKGGVEVIGPLGWIANWLSLSSLLCASLWWLFASVPVAVLRKTYISGKLFFFLTYQHFSHQIDQLHVHRLFHLTKRSPTTGRKRATNMHYSFFLLPLLP